MSTLLHDQTENVTISTRVTLEKVQNVTQIRSRSLDGTIYIQNIGEAEKNLNGTVYVDRDGRDALDTAYANGDLVTATVKHGTYQGRLIDVSYGDRMAHDWFPATIKIALEETE